MAGWPAEPGESDALRSWARRTLGEIIPAPEGADATPAARLGRALFWDVRLSADGRTSCGSCHQRSDWGADRRPFPIDARGRETLRHSQTVLNALLQPALRWTADRTSGVHQAVRSLTGSMGFKAPAEVVPLLERHGYRPLFEAAWPGAADPVTPENLARAIAVYEETLRTPAPFDRYLAGDPGALDAAQVRGLEVFRERGCADCHDGPLLGGHRIRRFGIHRPYPEATGSARHDPGLFEATGNEADRDRFRVAMLRNVGRTGPYFHDGSVAGLARAVQVMAEVQGGETLPGPDAAALVGFLGSLTGDIPPHYAPPDRFPGTD